MNAVNRYRGFISYRRDDTRYFVGRISEVLRRDLADLMFRDLPDDLMFHDVGSIDAGVPFRNAIDRAISGAAVVLVVIGPGWLDMTGPGGRRRLDDPDDLVRLEIETALRHGVELLPILVDDARMPGEHELPASIAALAIRKAVRIRSDTFDRGVAEVIQDVDGLVAAAFSERRPASDETFHVTDRGNYPGMAAAGGVITMSAMPTYDVFISHARPDAATANELAAQLSSRGLAVFLDAQIIQWGDNWTEIIDQAVQNASAVVVLISPDAAGSRGVQAEIATAQASARGGNSLLIPVLLGNLSPSELPPALQKFQYLRIDRQLGIAHAADEITRSIHNLLPRASNRIEGGIPDAPPNYFDTGQAQSLVDTLTSTLATETGPLEVVGVGGSGKTTLVAEACRRIRDQYDIVWFIRAVAPKESLISSLAALALKLGIDGRKSDPEELAADALTAIETSGRSWLIIFDEADSIGPALKRWLPRSSRTGTAVLVAREPLRWLNRATSRFYVTPLNKAWSIDFLRQQLTESVHADLREDDLVRISEVGGGLPLALRLIGAFLNNQSDSLDARVQQLLNPAATQQAETESLFSHALDRAAELTVTSGFILRTLSWLGDAPFPVDALILAADDEYLSSNPAEVEQTIRALQRASLIEVDEDALTIHDLVRAQLVRFHDPSSLTFLREAIANYLDSQAETPPKHSRWLAVHALNLLSGISYVLDSSEQAEFLVLAQRLARYLVQMQSFELAHQLLQQTLYDSDRILGPDHPSTLTTRANLAGVLQNLGRHEEAAALLQQTLYDSDRILGPDHPSTLTTRANLAGVLQNLGRHEEAAELLQQTLYDSLRALGPDDALTSTVQANLQFITRQLRSGGAHG